MLKKETKASVLKGLFNLVPGSHRRRVLRHRHCRDCKRVTPRIDSEFGGSFKEFVLTQDLPGAVSRLKRGLDADSIKLVDALLERMLLFPEPAVSRAFRVREELFFDMAATDMEKEIRRELLEQMKTLAARYGDRRILYDEKHASFFLLRHGMWRSPEKAAEYIAGKDFLDLGAWNGDSAMVFAFNYRPGKIFSFDLSEANLKLYRANMEKARIAPALFETVHMALGEKEGVAGYRSDNSMSHVVDENDEGAVKVPLTTVDTFVRERNLNPGFIKADVEGAEMACLRGMKETIQRFRPVLSLSIYHNPDQFFNLKPLLETMTEGLGYSFSIRLGALCVTHFAEVLLLAYPEELNRL